MAKGKKRKLNAALLKVTGMEAEAVTDKESEADSTFVRNLRSRTVEFGLGYRSAKKSLHRPSKKSSALSVKINESTHQNYASLKTEPLEDGLTLGSPMKHAMHNTLHSVEEFKDLELKKESRIIPEQELEQGVVKLHLVSNPPRANGHQLLEQFRAILDQQLPNIPSDHHKLLVYHKEHQTYVLVKKGKAIGGITFHSLPEDGLTEIVFYAITEVEQKCGYGSLLMDKFKKHVQDADYPLPLVTFADKRAICFFKKKGFIMRNRKDPEFREYLEKVPQYSNAILMLCDLKSTVEYPKLQETIHKILQLLNETKYSEPFAKPVDPKEVSWYYDWVKNPIDLQSIVENNLQGHYYHPRNFIKDMKLLFENCYFVNAIDTWYYEYGYELNKAFNGLCKEYFPKADISTNLPHLRPKAQTKVSFVELIPCEEINAHATTAKSSRKRRQRSMESKARGRVTYIHFAKHEKRKFGKPEKFITLRDLSSAIKEEVSQEEPNVYSLRPRFPKRPKNVPYFDLHSKYKHG